MRSLRISLRRRSVSILGMFSLATSKLTQRVEPLLALWVLWLYKQRAHRHRDIKRQKLDDGWPESEKAVFKQL